MNLLVPVRTIFLIVLLCLSVNSFGKDSWQGIERIVAIGDIHGDYDQMFSVLEMSGVIDQKGKWIGGNTHLVQAGDIPDRGPDTAKIIRFFMKLEKQAKKKKGFVHLLIGNHEAMNMIGDLRYVHPGEYSALQTGKSKSLRDAYYKTTMQWITSNNPPEEVPLFDDAYRRQWELKFPLGYVEHRRIWDKSGKFGKWVRKHNSVVKINDILFVHGGIGPAFAGYKLEDLNDNVVATLSAPISPDSIVEHADGPLWYRGLAQHEEEMERVHLEMLLQHFGVNRIVIAHTVTEGAIRPRFNGKVLLIDTGMAEYYGSHKAALVVEGGEYSVIHRGVKLDLPFAGDDVIAYVEKAMALEPEKRRLEMLVSRLKLGNTQIPSAKLTNADENQPTESP